MLDHLNALRLESGLRPFRLDRRLSAAAKQHSLEMVRVGYFAHESANGGAFWRRIRRFYPQAGSRRWVVGENLMWRAPWLSARIAVQSWLESPGHRENLLRRSFRDIGISAVRARAAPGVYGSRRVIVLTVDFGRR